MGATCSSREREDEPASAAVKKAGVLVVRFSKAETNESSADAFQTQLIKHFGTDFGDKKLKNKKFVYCDNNGVREYAGIFTFLSKEDIDPVMAGEFKKFLDDDGIKFEATEKYEVLVGSESTLNMNELNEEDYKEACVFMPMFDVTCPEAEFKAMVKAKLAKDETNPWKKIDGLVDKYFLYDAPNATGAGLYLFKKKADLDAYLASDVYKGFSATGWSLKRKDAKYRLTFDVFDMQHMESWPSPPMIPGGQYLDQVIDAVPGGTATVKGVSKVVTKTVSTGVAATDGAASYVPGGTAVVDHVKTNISASMEAVSEGTDVSVAATKGTVDHVKGSVDTIPIVGPTTIQIIDTTETITTTTVEKSVGATSAASDMVVSGAKTAVETVPGGEAVTSATEQTIQVTTEQVSNATDSTFDGLEKAGKVTTDAVDQTGVGAITAAGNSVVEQTVTTTTMVVEKTEELNIVNTVVEQSTTAVDSMETVTASAVEAVPGGDQVVGAAKKIAGEEVAAAEEPAAEEPAAEEPAAEEAPVEDKAYLKI